MLITITILTLSQLGFQIFLLLINCPLVPVVFDNVTYRNINYDIIVEVSFTNS